MNLDASYRSYCKHFMSAYVSFLKCVDLVDADEREFEGRLNV